MPSRQPRHGSRSRRERVARRSPAARRATRSSPIHGARSAWIIPRSTPLFATRISWALSSFFAFRTTFGDVGVLTSATVLPRQDSDSAPKASCGQRQSPFRNPADENTWPARRPSSAAPAAESLLPPPQAGRVEYEVHPVLPLPERHSPGNRRRPAGPWRTYHRSGPASLCESSRRRRAVGACPPWSAVGSVPADP